MKEKNLTLCEKCVSQLSLAVIQYLGKLTERRKRFILDYGFKGFRPWSCGSFISGPVVRQSIIVERAQWNSLAHLMVARKQREKTRGSRNEI
jgi:hypothetical protein